MGHLQEQPATLNPSQQYGYKNNVAEKQTPSLRRGLFEMMLELVKCWFFAIGNETKQAKASEHQGIGFGLGNSSCPGRFGIDEVVGDGKISTASKIFTAKRLKVSAVEVEQGVGSDGQIDISHHGLIEQHTKELRLAARARGHVESTQANLVAISVMPEVFDAAAPSVFHVDKNGTETARARRRHRTRNGEALTDEAVVELIRGIILHDEGIVGTEGRKLSCGGGVNAGEAIATYCVWVLE
ncbi:MAG: hypothetical protein K0S36_474 [Nitrosospira multiformis]|nr:hypothetical protein [Nitrosospira multiformis]